MILLV
jgi:hypothetical protein